MKARDIIAAMTFIAASAQASNIETRNDDVYASGQPLLFSGTYVEIDRAHKLVA